MLVLSRKPGEKLCIGDNITITVVEMRGKRVRLSLDAPDDIRIVRGELSFEFTDAVPSEATPSSAEVFA